jgi:hypothetical protein
MYFPSQGAARFTGKACSQPHTSRNEDELQELPELQSQTIDTQLWQELQKQSSLDNVMEYSQNTEDFLSLVLLHNSLLGLPKPLEGGGMGERYTKSIQLT